MWFSRGFTVVANATARAAGHPMAFLVCCAVIVIWGLSGPAFGYSETWQLVINTGTTIITFLMVFLIQNTQNRDCAALQAKLDELIRSSSAGNAFIGIENLTQEEVDDFRARCRAAAQVGDRTERSQRSADAAENRSHLQNT